MNIPVTFPFKCISCYYG